MRRWQLRLPHCAGHCLSFCFGARSPAADATNDPWTIDFRYAPPSWQTAICLPDDWQKTLVGKDGSLLYDYPGSYAGFGTRITFALSGETRWVKQELVSPRVPIVRTIQRGGDVEVVQERFAVAPPLASAPRRKPKSFGASRFAGWRKPAGRPRPPGSDPAFSSVAIGSGHPIQYRFKAKKDARYTVVFGLCEGYYAKPGQRILTLQVEGKSLRTVDMVAEKGRNQPEVFSFPARDENGDGWIDLAVAAAENSPDKNTILNTLWVFREADAPSRAELLSGRTPAGPGARRLRRRLARQQLFAPRLRAGANPQYRRERSSVAPTLVIESASPLTPDVFRRRVQIGAWTTLTYSPTILAMICDPQANSSPPSDSSATTTAIPSTTCSCVTASRNRSFSPPRSMGCGYCPAPRT